MSVVAKFLESARSWDCGLLSRAFAALDPCLLNLRCGIRMVQHPIGVLEFCWATQVSGTCWLGAGHTDSCISFYRVPTQLLLTLHFDRKSTALTGIDRVWPFRRRLEHATYWTSTYYETQHHPAPPLLFIVAQKAPTNRSHLQPAIVTRLRCRFIPGVPTYFVHYVFYRFPQ